jgi:asparagine synthase (glutamine-hydrolysing)
LTRNRPAWVDELLSPQSLTATGYFDPVKVNRAREIHKRKSKYSLQRFSLDLGLIGVIATQLWHHIFCGGGLADLGTWAPTQSAGRTSFAPRPHFLERAYAARTNGDSS